MNEIQLFKYEGRQVRTVQRDEKMWFVGRDVAEILGYSNPQKAVRDHCKRPEPVGMNESFTLDPQTVIIPEGDVYRLIARSNMPNAEKFESWVMDEVLPSINRTGSYSIVPKMPTHQEALRGWADALDENDRLKLQVSEMTPIVQTQKALTASPELFTLDEAGKILSRRFRSMGPRRIYQWMRENKILLDSKSRWNQAYQEHIDAGRFDVKNSHWTNAKTGEIHPHVQTYITQKGLDWLAGQLIKEEKNHIRLLPTG